GPSILVTTAERDAIIAALERAEQLEGLLREKIDAGIYQGFSAAQDALEAELKSLRERAARLEAVLRALWDSIPSSDDTDDPMVQRHAAALNALGSLLAPAPAEDGG